MKHSWKISTNHPDICMSCGEVRGPDSDKEECIPNNWLEEMRKASRKKQRSLRS